MKVTLNLFTKSRHNRLYINSDDGDTRGSFIEFEGGEYNRYYGECRRVSRRYYGDEDLCRRVEEAVFSQFKEAAFLSDGKGGFTMTPDAVLTFAARNALKAGGISFSSAASKTAWQKMNFTFNVEK